MNLTISTIVTDIQYQDYYFQVSSSGRHEGFEMRCSLRTYESNFHFFNPQNRHWYYRYTLYQDFVAIKISGFFHLIENKAEFQIESVFSLYYICNNFVNSCYQGLSSLFGHGVTQCLGSSLSSFQASVWS